MTFLSPGAQNYAAGHALLVGRSTYKYLDMYLPRLVVSTASTFLAVVLARERSVQALLALQVISKSTTVEHRSK